jgi:hypothetical protein
MSTIKVNTIQDSGGNTILSSDGSGNVTTSNIADNSVSLAKLTATGTKDATTFLRGDNTFAQAGGDVVDDTSPQLGGNLDLNSNAITGTGNLDIADGTIKLDGNYPVGTDNVALGNTALDSVTSTGANNTAVGSNAMTTNTTGLRSTGVGTNALQNSNANNNTGIGYNSLQVATGENNTALGTTSGWNNSTGSNNLFLGQSAGDNVTTGSNNIVIGRGADASSASVSNEITIGNTTQTVLRMPGLQSSASSGDVLTFDGTNLSLSAPSGGGTSWSVITGNTTATAGSGYLVDTSSASITLTLPSSASTGDQISFVDMIGDANVRNITIARNGHRIQGLTQDLTVDTSRAGNTLVYSGSTLQGWVLTNN